ncbi:hypothetical protein [Streptomyces melanogenes]|uniref:Uncharacterized protein n=1 Tax=Streptomyces melanogenes TaxID=67326 RepID=A0ABZ1XTV8_9ACTN|nr:hypothetical protein [Streptomyces melanogenes]
MRYAFRTGLAAATLVGSVIVPSVAFASTSHGARSASDATAADRCTVVKRGGIGAGLDVRLTMSPKGPSVVFVDEADGSQVKDLGTLNRSHPALARSAGIDVEILNAYGSTPQLLAKTNGGTSGYYEIQNFPTLPKGCSLDEGTVVKQCTVSQQDGIGAGLDARLTMSPKGPSVVFVDEADGSQVKRLGTLNRSRPKLPASAGIYAEIVQPSSWEPQLKSKTQGGTTRYAFTDFPKLPKGCPLY